MFWFQSKRSGVKASVVVDEMKALDRAGGNVGGWPLVFLFLLTSIALRVSYIDEQRLRPFDESGISFDSDGLGLLLHSCDIDESRWNGAGIGASEEVELPSQLEAM